MASALRRRASDKVPSEGLHHEHFNIPGAVALALITASTLTSAVAGLLAALLQADGMTIIGWAAGTFLSVLLAGLAVTAFVHPPSGQVPPATGPTPRPWCGRGYRRR